jgi:hypothetical protein
MAHVIGTNIRITGIKTVLKDIKDEVRATVYREYTVLNLHLGWAEQ